jgi:tetratricopeptide (TPR) repeat protein
MQLFNLVHCKQPEVTEFFIEIKVMTAFEKELIEKYNLPIEVLETLQDKINLLTVVGHFTLGPVSELTLIAIKVGHQAKKNIFNADVSGGASYPNGPATPHDHLRGEYWTPAISLIGGAQYGEAIKGELIWLPRMRVFGTWDSNHLELYVFPDVSWQALFNRLDYFLTYIWQLYKDCKDEKKCNVYPNVQDYVNVWEYFDFLPSYSEVMQFLPVSIKQGFIEPALNTHLKNIDPSFKQFPFHEYKQPYKENVLLSKLIRADTLLKQKTPAVFTFPRTIKEAIKDWSKLCFSISKAFYNTDMYELTIQWLGKFLHYFSLLNEEDQRQLQKWDEIKYYQYYAGIAHYKQGQYKEGKHYLEKYIIQYPNHASTYFFLGRIADAIDGMKEAIPYYQKAIELNIANPWAYANLAVCIAETEKDYEKAIAYTICAIELASKDEMSNAMLYANLACFYSMDNNINDALKALETALSKGYPAEKIMTDKDLENVRKDVRLQTLYATKE